MMLQFKGVACTCKDLKQRLLEQEPISSTLANSTTLYHRTSATIFEFQSKTLMQAEWRMNTLSWWQ